MESIRRQKEILFLFKLLTDGEYQKTDGDFFFCYSCGLMASIRRQRDYNYLGTEE